MAGLVKLAFQSMFDIDARAARNYMNACAGKIIQKRDVSPAGVFRAAGDFLRLGIKQAREKYPELRNGRN